MCSVKGERGLLEGYWRRRWYAQNLKGEIGTIQGQRIAYTDKNYLNEIHHFAQLAYVKKNLNWNNTIKELNQVDVYRQHHWKPAENILCSNVQCLVTKLDHIMGQKAMSQ